MESNNKIYLTSDENVLLDVNYRYKIPKLTYKFIVKKGTTITIINDFEQFCKNINFDNKILIKYLGKKLSVKTSYDDNLKSYFLQSKIEFNDVNNVIYNFIKKYLLCVLCDKPEITLKNKNNNLQQKCNACGNSCYLGDNDDLIKYFN